MLTRVLLVTLVVTLPSLAFAQCKTTAGCPVPGQSGTQLCVPDSARIMERGSRNRILANGPTLPQIGAGCTATRSVDPSVPCVLTKAIGYVESTWTQFCAPACSGTGLTVISFDCGYGVMQVTSGMSGGAGFDPQRVARETQYNIGTGLKILLDKWKGTPCVGDNQPTVLEDWYFATWAYNSFGFVNNPNNPSFPASRPPYNGTGSLSRGSYPYQ